MVFFHILANYKYAVRFASYNLNKITPNPLQASKIILRYVRELSFMQILKILSKEGNYLKILFACTLLIRLTVKQVIYFFHFFLRDPEHPPWFPRSHWLRHKMSARDSHNEYIQQATGIASSSIPWNWATSPSCGSIRRVFPSTGITFQGTLWQQNRRLFKVGDFVAVLKKWLTFWIRGFRLICGRLFTWIFEGHTNAPRVAQLFASTILAVTGCSWCHKISSVASDSTERKCSPDRRYIVMGTTGFLSSSVYTFLFQRRKIWLIL